MFPFCSNIHLISFAVFVQVAVKRYNIVKNENSHINAAAPNSQNILLDNHQVHVIGAKVNSLMVLFDMQGRVLYKNIVKSTYESFEIPKAGSYILKVGSTIQRIRVK